jgi:glycosyltransferase involved in cell wall biosynthesis
MSAPIPVRTEPARPSVITVGVVVPCHNYGRFLAEAVETLMTQTRLADEVIIIDDGSTDDTAVVVADLLVHYPTLRHARHDTAWGAVATFNDGIRALSTDAVMLLSADDRLSPTYLERSAEVLEAGADIAFTPAHLFGDDDAWWEIPEFDAEALLLHNRFHGSALYRRWLFDHAGGYRPVLYEDWDLWVAGVLAGARGQRVEGCWLEYRKHGPSRSTVSPWRGRVERFRIWWGHRHALGWRRLLRLSGSLAAEFPRRVASRLGGS